MSVKLAVDNTRRRRQVAVPQAAIARAIRAARDAAGPNWRVEIEGNVIRLSEREPAATPSTRDTTSPVRDFTL